MHRLVNECLAEELAGPVHALRIDAYPTSKYNGEVVQPSPACTGAQHTRASSQISVKLSKEASWGNLTGPYFEVYSFDLILGWNCRCLKWEQITAQLLDSRTFRPYFIITKILCFYSFIQWPVMRETLSKMYISASISSYMNIFLFPQLYRWLDLYSDESIGHPIKWIK